MESADPCRACASVPNGSAIRRAMCRRGATRACWCVGPLWPNSKRHLSQSWNATGAPLEAFAPVPDRPVGSVALRVIATQPASGSVYRLDQLIASMARKSLWLSDAYFVGITPYVQALVAAARDGVDVRMLVPGSSDIPAVAGMSRTGYRPLLKAGIRVFEWNGSMLHAKTAVADGQWARVGSSNLNVRAGWAIARSTSRSRMPVLPVCLQPSTNLICRMPPKSCWRRVAIAAAKHILDSGARPPRVPPAGGSSGRAAAGALRIANSVGAAWPIAECWAMRPAARFWRHAGVRRQSRLWRYFGRVGSRGRSGHWPVGWP